MSHSPTFLVVTPNPAIDRRIHVPHLAVSGVNRATEVVSGAGGKGLNVVRAARTLGCHAIAVAPLGGHTGHLFADLAAGEGLASAWYWLETGETRISSLVTHQGQDTTVINEPGPVLTKTAWPAFTAHIRRLARQSKAVAFSGSLPPGVDPAKFCELARSLVLLNRRVYLDTSGEVLKLALAQPTGLDIKVNREELAAGLQQPLVEIIDVVNAGKTLLARGASAVVVTLGRVGVLVIAPEGCWQAASPSVKVTSTVGSGDSLLAGLAVARLNGQPLESALKMGVACGAANAMSHLPGRFAREMVEELLGQVKVEKLT